MAFSALSLDIRNLIYHALLCPPDGVLLHHSDECWTQKEEDEEDWEFNWEGGDFKRRGFSYADASAVTSIPTAIFSVNRQIRQEATDVFYGFNRFTFENDARTTLKFLKDLRPSFRRRIKHIGFPHWSTSANDHSGTEYWAPLHDFIIHHMHVISVTIQVPRDLVHGIDEAKEARPAPDPEWYWWHAAQLLTGSLMAGKIQKVRLGYSATLQIRDPEEEAQYIEAEQAQHENPLENLSSISSLRYPHPRPDEECDREYHEHKDLSRAIDKGRPHKFASFRALRTDQLTRRRRFDFVVTREDDPIGDVGTVLVLTRPKMTQGYVLG